VIFEKLKKTPFPIYLVLLCLVSCTSPKKESEQPEFNPEVFQSFQLSINSERKKFASLIDSIELIPLEETNQSLLTSVSRVIKYDDQYLVINKGDEEIVFFDSEGKYLKTFNRLGEGPREYQSINSFWVQDDLLSIYERKRTTIFNYTLDGNFVDSRKLPTQVGHVRKYGDEYVVEFGINATGDSLFYKFGVLDENLVPKDLYLKTDDISTAVVWSKENSVIPYQDGLLLMRMNSDTTYFYKKGEFEPLIHFDFGEEWYWKNGAILKSEDYDLIETSGQAWDIITRMNDKFIYARAVVAFSGYEHFLIDRSTCEAVRMDLRKDAETELVPYNLGWEDDRWLISMTPDDLLFLAEELGVDLPNTDQISQSENPVLVKVKFKDSSAW